MWRAYPALARACAQRRRVGALAAARGRCEGGCSRPSTPGTEEAMKVKTYLKASVMPWRIPKLLREEQTELARFGEVPAPGKATLTFPAGTVKATYKESKKSGGDEDKIYFGWSQSLEVTVRPAGGGEPLELDRGYGSEI